MTAVLSAQAPAPVPVTRRRARWERWSLVALLLGAAALYLVNLSVNGWANAYYAGAVQAMTRSWEAFFFGGADAGGIITVDKPPAALWVMAVSAKVFGLSSWSLLVPQALMGVGTVALVHAAVRRVSGPGAALVAGVIMALTPVAVLMFRFDNPDALLVLLMAAAAYAMVRAVELAGTRWLVLAGVCIGLAFLTKTAQAFLVLPGFALAYLWAAPTGWWRRVRQLLGAGLAVVVSGGWWFVVVDLWPAGTASGAGGHATRPYIAGSTTNSALELALGYNGLGRIFGGGEGIAGGGSPFGGSAGIGRLFAADVGGQVAWLLPAALVLLVVGLLATRRAPRTDAVRASLLLWGGWTLVTAAVFSLMSGVFHQYYTVALVPGIAALVGIGGAQLWRRRTRLVPRATLALVTAGTAAWAIVLLLRTPALAPLAWAVGALGVLGAAALLVGRRRAAVAGLVAAVLAGSVGPAAYAAITVSSAQTGAIPLAGPAVVGGGPGGGMRPDGRAPGGSAALPGGGQPDGGVPAGGFPDGGFPDGGFPDGGAAFGAEVTDPELVGLLQVSGTRWSAATVSTASSARYALDSGTDVIGIGGFTGSDPAPTLAQFQQLVADGEVRWYLPGRAGGGPGGGAGPATEIATWVQATFTPVTVGGTTVYDLAAPLG